MSRYETRPVLKIVLAIGGPVKIAWVVAVGPVGVFFFILLQFSERITNVHFQISRISLVAACFGEILVSQYSGVLPLVKNIPQSE